MKPSARPADPAAALLDGERWELRPWFRARHVAVALVAVVLVSWSAHRVDVPEFFALTGEAVLQLGGLRESSQVGDALMRSMSGLFPVQLETAVPVSQLSDDEMNMGGGRIEERMRTQFRVDPETLENISIEVAERYYVRQFGYLFDTLERMLETVEMGLWATLLGMLISIPLALGGAKNFSPNGFVYRACRAVVAFFRAVPELISALFLVLAYGFGPIAGILAMGIHCAGFFGKFFADDIENADDGPQEAVRSLGVSELVVLRHAVLPQVLPQYVSYVLYIVDRNVRTATVIGLVGAGGIGQELKGRFDLFEYGHVATILLVIFATVLIIERISVGFRVTLIGGKA